MPTSGRSPRHGTTRACTGLELSPWSTAPARPVTEWRVPRRSALACPRARSGRAIPADCHWDQKIEFPTREDSLLSMIELLDPDLPLPKHLARPDDGFCA